MKEAILQEAQFNPSVKSYWLVVFAIVSGLTVIGIPLLIVTLPIVYLVCKRILEAMSATLFERKLVVKRGVFFKVEKSIPLEKITDVALVQGPLMRAFGLQQLSFETAGQSDAGALVSLLGVEGAEGFREAILAQKDALMLSSSDNAPNEAVPLPSDIQTLTESVQRIEALLTQLVDAKSTSNGE